MMDTKLFRITDIGTEICVMAVKFDGTETEEENKILSRGGWGQSNEARKCHPYVILIDITGTNLSCTNDPYDWLTSTLKIAHMYIKKNFNSLHSCQTINVEELRKIYKF